MAHKKTVEIEYQFQIGDRFEKKHIITSDESFSFQEKVTASSYFKFEAKFKIVIVGYLLIFHEKEETKCYIVKIENTEIFTIISEIDLIQNCTKL